MELCAVATEATGSSPMSYMHFLPWLHKTTYCITEATWSAYAIEMKLKFLAYELTCSRVKRLLKKCLVKPPR